MTPPPSNAEHAPRVAAAVLILGCVAMLVALTVNFTEPQQAPSNSASPVLATPAVSTPVPSASGRIGSDGGAPLLDAAAMRPDDTGLIYIQEPYPAPVGAERWERPEGPPRRSITTRTVAAS